MTRRGYISWKTKYAAALLALGDVSYEDAKLMTADQIISLYHVDHGILHAVAVNDQFWNLTPRLIALHRPKSRRDTTAVAKMKRLTEDQAEFVRKVLARPCGQKRERRSRIPSRPFAKRPKNMERK